MFPGPVHTVTNTWEANRDVILTKGNSRNIDASDISSIGYTVNAIGQRTNATRSGAATNSTAWAYDNLGQLVQADDSAATSDRAYQYDSIGNREKTAIGSLELPGNPNYVANALNQYTTIPQATATPVYDLDGNMTTGPLPVSPTTNSTLVWDAENRLVEIKNGATTLAAYSYDALSRRISATVGEATTLYLYDGFNSIAEYSGTTLAKTYLWGMDLSGSMQGAGGVGGLLVENHHAGPTTTTTFYPCFDGNGNITEYLNSDGTVAAHFEYDPFGNTTVNTDTNNVFAYRFSTKPIDFETGLYYYNYRYYDPLTGRWPSRDPINEIGFRAVNGEQLGIARLDGKIRSWRMPQIIQGETRISLRDIEESLKEYQNEGKVFLREELNLYLFVFNKTTDSYDRLGLCVCCFKGRTGKLTVDASCRGTRMWVIDEDAAPAAGATAGVTVSADGFVLGGSTYKIDGSTCVTMTCSGGAVVIDTCTNLLASLRGSGPAHIVPPGSFGGPPKEPTPGTVPPLVK